MKAYFILVSGCLLTYTTTAFAQDDPAKNCQRAAKLIQDNDIEGALEEARWCVTQLEQIKQNQTASYFADEVFGFKGEPVSQQSAMGMTVVSRQYLKGNDEISVTLTGGQTGGAMGAFAAMAQFGMQAGNSKVRINKRNGTITQDGDSITLMLSLKSGALLNFESSSLNKETVVAFAEAFPVAALDESLQE